MDDLINNDVGSSASSSVSDGREPSSSLHNLPAWSTSEEGDEWSGSSPVNSDGAAGDSAAINDVWFAPSSTLSRKKRTLSKKNAFFAEERQTSPGAATSNLKSHKSAPQLVKKRIVSSDHQAKLQDLLVEMGWPVESSKATAEEAVDADYGSQQQSSNSSSATHSYSSINSGAGAGSLASGMPVTSALFRRRAANNKEGDMPAPSQVVVPATEDVFTHPGSAYPTFGDAMVHSRSATLPREVDTALMARPLPVHSMSSSYLSLLNSNVASNPAFINPQAEAAKKQYQDALYYGLNSATQQQTPLLMQSSPYIATPDTGSSANSHEIQTPLTPFQSLSVNDMGASLPYSYSVSPANSMSSQLASGYSYPVKSNKTPADLDMSGTLGNSLGLSFMPSMNQIQKQQQTPAMIDSSSYAQIFAKMNASTSISNQPSLKQMKSSPNMRISPSLEGSPMKSPLRKIASNRRLTVSISDNANIGSSSPISSPMKTPCKKGKSPRASQFAVPPMPTYMSSPGIQNQTIASSSSSNFEFVNYGIEDADELCSAVAPSGSYKVPLKGFGGSQNDDDEDDLDDAGDDEDDGERKLHRSRSKSSSRLGPRWQGAEHEDQINIGAIAAEKALRQVKRRKSEANMMLSSASRKKNASSSNLRRKD
jgi:hypothetical protein